MDTFEECAEVVKNGIKDLQMYSEEVPVKTQSDLYDAVQRICVLLHLKADEFVNFEMTDEYRRKKQVVIHNRVTELRRFADEDGDGILAYLGRFRRLAEDNDLSKEVYDLRINIHKNLARFIKGAKGRLAWQI